MTSKLMLLELRKLIAAGADVHILLYFLDHIYQLLPKQDRQQQLLLNLQQKNSKLQRKLKQLLNDKKDLDQTLSFLKFELEIRIDKFDKLEREIKKMRYDEARRVRRQRKEEEKRKTKSNSVELILGQFQMNRKISVSNITQISDSIADLVEHQEKTERSRLRYSFGYSAQNDSSPYFQNVNVRDNNPQLQSEEQQRRCAVLEQYAKARPMSYLTVTIVQPII